MGHDDDDCDESLAKSCPMDDVSLLRVDPVTRWNFEVKFDEGFRRSLTKQRGPYMSNASLLKS